MDVDLSAVKPADHAAQQPADGATHICAIWPAQRQAQQSAHWDAHDAADGASNGATVCVSVCSAFSAPEYASDGHSQRTAVVGPQFSAVC